MIYYHLISRTPKAPLLTQPLLFHFMFLRQIKYFKFNQGNSTQWVPPTHDIWMVLCPLSHFIEYFAAPDFRSNLSLLALFVFCLATAVIIGFWSAVIAGGKRGPDGVLRCMNAELGKLELNRQSLNGVYPPPAPFQRQQHTTEEHDLSQTNSNQRGMKTSLVGLSPYLLIFHALTT